MPNLSDAKIRDITPPATGRIEIIDDMQPGLRLRVSASGTRSFIIRKRQPGGKTAVVTLGTYGPGFTLSAARKKARLILSDLEGGKAPPKVVRSSTRTIRALLPGYIEAKKTNRTISETERTFERLILPVLGDRVAAAVMRVDIKRFIKGIENPSNRRAAFAALSSFYTYVMDEENDLDEIAVNPCRDAKRPPKAEARTRVLSDAEIGAVYLAADAIGYPYGTGVKLLALTALRRGEVFKAEWSEIDMKKGEWIIPAARSKNKQPHLVPLTPGVKAILETMPRFEDSPYLFPARGLPKKTLNSFSKGASKLKAALAKQLPESPEWRIHDLRRTAATKLQSLGAPLPVTSAVLNHSVRAPDIGTATHIYALYAYASEKREFLTKLEAEILRLADG